MLLTDAHPPADHHPHPRHLDEKKLCGNVAEVAKHKAVMPEEILDSMLIDPKSVPDDRRWLGCDARRGLGENRRVLPVSVRRANLVDDFDHVAARRDAHRQEAALDIDGSDIGRSQSAEGAGLIARLGAPWVA